MLKKIKDYFNEIAECEELERRNSKEWAEKGNMDEVIRMAKFKERKTRNSLIYYAIMIGGTALYNKRLKQIEQKAELDRKSRSARVELEDAISNYREVIYDDDSTPEEMEKAKQRIDNAEQKFEELLKLT